MHFLSDIIAHRNKPKLKLQGIRNLEQNVELYVKTETFIAYKGSKLHLLFEYGAICTKDLF